MRKALIVRTSGETELRQLERAFTFTDLQAIVGEGHEGQNWIELVNLPPPGFVNIAKDDYVTVWVNEEGLLHQLEYNGIASALCGRMLVGTVLFLNYQEEDE